RDVAARPCQARDKALLQRIADYHDDGDGTGRLLGSPRRWAAERHQGIHLKLDQVGCVVASLLVRAPVRSPIDEYVLPYHIAKLTQLLQEWRLLEIDRRDSRDHADAGHLRQRLRVGAERRQEQAEGERDDASDRAAPHEGLLSSIFGIPLLPVDMTKRSSHGHLPTTQD